MDKFHSMPAFFINMSLKQLTTLLALLILPIVVFGWGRNASSRCYLQQNEHCSAESGLSTTHLANEMLERGVSDSEADCLKSPCDCDLLTTESPSSTERMANTTAFMAYTLQHTPIDQTGIEQCTDIFLAGGDLWMRYHHFVKENKPYALAYAEMAYYLDNSWYLAQAKLTNLMVMADAYEKQGQLPLAISSYEKALEFIGDSDAYEAQRERAQQEISRLGLSR